MTEDQGQEQMAIASAELAMSERLIHMALEHLDKANQARTNSSPLNFELLAEFNRVIFRTTQVKNLMCQGMLKEMIANGQQYIRDFIV